MAYNYGYQNEYDFVKLFHDKYFFELDYQSQLFLKELFGDAINNENKIQSWKNKMTQNLN